MRCFSAAVGISSNRVFFLSSFQGNKQGQGQGQYAAVHQTANQDGQALGEGQVLTTNFKEDLDSIVQKPGETDLEAAMRLERARNAENRHAKKRRDISIFLPF